jgi:hypothetical protein
LLGDGNVCFPEPSEELEHQPFTISAGSFRQPLSSVATEASGGQSVRINFGRFSQAVAAFIGVAVVATALVIGLVPRVHEFVRMGGGTPQKADHDLGRVEEAFVSPAPSRKELMLSSSLDTSTQVPPAANPVAQEQWQDICNSTALIPEPQLRGWQLQAGWKRVCELKNQGDDVASDRNWCWIGVKRQCHAHLKEHFSWLDYQARAAEKGRAPPVGDSPFSGLEDPEVCDRPELGKASNWTESELSTAREWFDQHVNVYVLNLDSDKKRWESIQQRLSQLNIPAQRVAGVDMRKPDSLQFAKEQGWVLPGFNFSKAQATAYLPEHEMGSILGTLGCAAGHFKAQGEVLVKGSPLGIVFEDDSLPEDDFVARVWSLVTAELPCDWEAVALMSRCPYGRCISPHLVRVLPDVNEPGWRCRQGVNWGMHAVMYRTDSLSRLQYEWQKTVFDEKRPHCMDVDVALASISDKVAFYAVPSVQEPGFLREADLNSARWSINQEFQTSTTAAASAAAGPRKDGEVDKPTQPDQPAQPDAPEDPSGAGGVG